MNNKANDPENLHLDPKYWKWGFYYNKEDKRVLVPKQNPDFGATLNFAHPTSIYISIAVLIFITIVFILAFVYG